MQVLEIEKIRIDGGTQARAAIDESKVKEYAEAMEYGSKFEPVVVFFDGTDHWLADGFHRYHASRKCDFKSMSCDVRKGTKRDAILFAVGANSTHGLHRTNADKKKAVMILLEDSEWGKKSATWIAETAGVSVGFASEIKKSLFAANSQSSVGKDGRVIDTSKIGQAKKPRPSKPTDDIPMTGIPAAPKPLEPEPVTTDQAGGTIEDKEVADCFARYSQIRQLCNQLSAILATVKKKITSGDPLFGRTNEPQLKAAIGNARRELTINEPYAVCPSCGGKRAKDCRVCKGTKYATKEEHARYEASMGALK